MNDDQFRDLTRDFLQQLAYGSVEEPVASSGLLVERPAGAPSRGQAVRQSWGELMEVLVKAVTMARAFSRLNDPEGLGEPPVEETGFGGSESAEMSSLLQDVWEGAGFDPSEIFKGYRY